MAKEKLRLAGWMAIANALITILIIGSFAFFRAHLGEQAEIAQAILMAVSAWLFICVFLSLKKMLNTGFGFYDTDVFIKWITWIKAVLTAVSVVPLFVPRAELGVGILGSLILIIPMGIILILLSVTLLRLEDNLYELLKPFAYVSIATGFCFTAISLIPFALITGAASDIILGMIFFRAAETGKTDAMSNNLRSSIATTIVRIISSVVGFVNGLWLIFAGASYFKESSPYYELIALVPKAYRDQYDILFWFPITALTAPLLGALLGTLVGLCINRLFQREIDPTIMRLGTIFGGVAGFLSQGAVFLNIYAS
ncbi:MAG: hypothetical protein ACOYYU_10710 [Chloroflexota bacterium]